MAKSNLVIVESPAKAKTIGKYLGPGYEVKASMGHVRDLPKSKLGVDVTHGRHHLITRSKVLADGLGLGRGLYNDQICLCCHVTTSN